MPELNRSPSRNYQYDGPGHTALPASAAPAPDIRPRLLRLGLLPLAAAAAIGVGVALFVSRVDLSSEPVWMPAIVIGTAVVFIGLVAFLVVHTAGGIDADVSRRIGEANRATAEFHYRLIQAQEAAQRREAESAQRPRPAGPAPSETAAAADRSPVDSTRPGTRVGIFVNRARRLQALAHREIVELDEMERQVEDPALLKALFSVDHIATRVRRHAENLAVLGGGPSHRLWSRPVNVYEALRSAVAEVEHYSRVKLVRPIEGRIDGHAAADFIHLTAELIENATVFSAPETEVLIRVARVRSGLAVEVEDRGLGMVQEERDRYNQLLAEPAETDLDELLADGRIGLYVVAALADRHDLVVRLQSNIFGGTQAVVIVGEHLLGEGAPVPAQAESPRRAESSAAASKPAPQSPAGPEAPPTHAELQAAPPRTAPAPPVRPEPSAPQLPTVQLGGPAPAAGPGSRPTAGSRPPLPRRNRQTHLAPQLRDASPTHPTGSDAAHDPGLMQAFQRGRHRGEEQTDPAYGPDSDPTPYKEEDA